MPQSILLASRFWSWPGLGPTKVAFLGGLGVLSGSVLQRRAGRTKLAAMGRCRGLDYSGVSGQAVTSEHGKMYNTNSRKHDPKNPVFLTTCFGHSNENYCQAA
jgi:hypothetical protein